VNTFAGRNNGRNPESPEFSEPPFSGFISPQQNLAMQHMRNIGMFEQKTPLRETSRQCFFLSRIQHIAQQNTWAVSGCRYFFLLAGCLSDSIHSQGHLNWRITPLSKQFATPIYQLIRQIWKGNNPSQGTYYPKLVANYLLFGMILQYRVCLVVWGSVL